MSSLRCSSQEHTSSWPLTTKSSPTLGTLNSYVIFTLRLLFKPCMYIREMRTMFWKAPPFTHFRFLFLSAAK
jgi:hypothetical protein